ncbi:MAG: CooT family nickel-binding protein [Desulfobacterales bacterium]|nr:CooT family nickel-binding protein [Desulfobacterales bacterium]
MCESNVFVVNNGKETLIMENVASIKPMGENQFVLKGLLGDQKELQGRIVEINLMAHKILFSGH